MNPTTAFNTPEDIRRREQSLKLLLYFGIGSMIMLFAGLTSAYIVRLGEGNWWQIIMPKHFYISTAIILISSLTMNMALIAAKKNDPKTTVNYLLITLALGIAFVITQFLAWKTLTEGGIFFAGPSSNASGSFLYMLSGLHMAHLAGGLIALVTVLFRASQKKYNAEHLTGIQLCATYWHFLDILWIYLFLFLLFIR